MDTRPKAVIVSAVRTPIARFNGVFRSTPATKLGSSAIGEALKRIDLPDGGPSNWNEGRPNRGRGQNGRHEPSFPPH